MRIVEIIVVTGLPGTGKSTLAHEIARRHRLPLIAKDFIKEPLLDLLGAVDAAQSRRLSDASFAALFRLARESVSSGVGVVLEGNFRPGEHEGPLRQAVGSCRLAQILCRLPEATRLAHLGARETDPSRHVGHRLGERLSAPAGDAFLDLPSARFLRDEGAHRTVLSDLENWMNLR